jgi:hypothetical protein
MHLPCPIIVIEVLIVLQVDVPIVDVLKFLFNIMVLPIRLATMVVSKVVSCMPYWQKADVAQQLMKREVRVS